MDVREQFHIVVAPSYTQFKEQGDFWSLPSAITDQATLSSAGIDPNNQATWYINEKYLPKVADDGFAKLSGL